MSAEGTVAAARSFTGSARPACYYRVSVLGVVRHESLSQREAESRAREIYTSENVIPEIEEVPIQPA